MYLTRFRINTQRRDARRLLSSPHLMHGAVNAAFPQLPPRGVPGPRVLWRVDHEPSGRALLYVTSPSRPDLTHLVEQAGWPAAEGPGWDSFPYGDFLGALAAGDSWGFRLTANPVHAVRLSEDRTVRTKRLAHVTARQQLGWLLKRQKANGFEVLRKPEERRLPGVDEGYEVMLRDRLPLKFRRPTGAKGDVQFTRVTYDGRLRVTNVDLLRRALTQGLGKAKAYGCGLMTLAPVNGATEKAA
ncbi:type I-E CRISPR-associated protein Cas6/Cse3/CasE [Streptomyces sp. NPDC049906]|uniref:type I-E CRISPR-associated protein Cas6/Cse3/CasE n=1 Tax=Streptomyces sp. NPDC049906 TaxID=3155656 RepID=UPI00343BEE81